MKHEGIMDIYAKRGSKVVFANPTAGYPHHQQECKDAGLVVGATYTVAETEVHSSSSRVFLQEFPGRGFNTVMFEDATSELAAQLESNEATNKLSDVIGTAKRDIKHGEVIEIKLTPLGLESEAIDFSPLNKQLAHIVVADTASSGAQTRR